MNVPVKAVFIGQRNKNGFKPFIVAVVISSRQ
jgi:hypothetical protein